VPILAYGAATAIGVGILGLEPAAEDHRRVLAVLTYLRNA
jgi:hypothetical protein